MKKFYLLLIVFCFMNGLKAQYVTIPDTNFVYWLQANIPTAMNGNQMDTTSPAISTIVSADFQGLIGVNMNLTGIKYLSSLQRLNCQDFINGLYIPSFPTSLKRLELGYNDYQIITSFPPSLDTLIWSENYNSNFPVLPASLKYLNCNSAYFTFNLAYMPVSLRYFSCTYSNLSNLTYLPDSLEYMECQGSNLSTLPALPATLKYLNCSELNAMTSLPALPAGLQSLYCGGNSLTSLPALPDSLQILNCNINNLNTLPSLPASLQNLSCGSNNLNSLPALPASLIMLYCSDNHLTGIPALPGSLKYLYCNNNLLTTLTISSSSLQYLDCSFNLLTSLSSLPVSLTLLNCQNNQITTLPSLPQLIRTLNCGSNQLSMLPSLPDSLRELTCCINVLTSLPALPDSLHYLQCAHNILNVLPALPNALLYLYCNNNQLTSLPSLHPFWQFNCKNNLISCFPTLYDKYQPDWWEDFNDPEFSILGNPFTCLPNYTNFMSDTLLAYPLCMTGDPLNNPNSCNGISGIAGTIFKDINSNCIKDSLEQKISNVHMMLYDNLNNLVAQTYSLSNGVYNFAASAGTYTVKIDTVGMPFTVQCVNPGIATTVTLTPSNPSALNVNFPLVCKNSFDLGVQSISHNGLVFPGQLFNLIVCAGDMSQWSQLHCTTGVGGQVQITVNGPAIYQGVAPGALTPTMSGTVFTYTIANFGTINNCTDFGLIFLTDTTAEAGNQVCVNVSVTPVTGDYNPSNNNYYQCFDVTNSLDPNLKEVFPLNVVPGYNGYFTYTIHFQNTGNANAINIKLVDTLSANLDVTTFKVLGYSHPNTVLLTGNVLKVMFSNIQLPDSSNNPAGSMGYFQYSIKPVANLPEETHINNTAFIFFDYNAPMATNTTTNVFNVIGIANAIESLHSVKLYPNPAKNKLYISALSLITKAEIFDISGKLLLTKQLTSSQIDIRDLAQGFYFIKLTTNEGSVVKKFVKE